MTMIAVTFNHNNPFILADTLFTSDEVNNDVHLPTNHVPVNSILNKLISDNPLYLRQKLYIIQPNVCVVIAGLENELAPFVAELRTSCKYYSKFGEKQVTSDELQAFLKQYELGNNMSQSGFAIFHTERDEAKDKLKLTSILRGKWEAIEHELFEVVMAYGSGANDFINHISKEIQRTVPLNTEDFYDTIKLQSAYIARLLASERTTLKNLDNGWGAAYEIAYISNEGFEKLKGLAYIIIEGKLHKDGSTSDIMPTLIIFNDYIDDVLYVHSIEPASFQIEEMDNRNRYISKQFSHQIYRVRSIEKTQTIVDIELSETSFETPAIAFGVSLMTDDNKPIYGGFVELNSYLKLVFNESIEFDISHEAIELIKKAAKSAQQ